MKASTSLAVLVALTSLNAACSRPFSVSNRTGSNSGISDVSVKFKDTLNPELRKHLTNYHIVITPNDDRCKRDKMDTAVDEQKEWTPGADLVIKAHLAANCTYLLKFDFGSMDNNKTLVPLFSNYVNKVGDLVTTVAGNMIVPITAEITEAGRKLGLEKYTPRIESSLETNLEATIIFGATLKLDGEYLISCVSDGAAQPKFLSRNVKVAGDTVSVSDRYYASADCSDANLISEEIGEAKFQVGATIKTATTSANEFNLVSVTKKSFKAGDKFSGDWCGKSTWTKGSVVDVLADSTLTCKTDIAGIAPFDLVALKDDKLSFGARINGKDGSSAVNRPIEVSAAALPKKK